MLHSNSILGDSRRTLVIKSLGKSSIKLNGLALTMSGLTDEVQTLCPEL